MSLTFINSILCILQNRWPDGTQRTSKVYAYHGLKTPPYKLVSQMIIITMYYLSKGIQ